MELWIRSQDKTQLIKVNNLHLKRDIDIDFEKVLILNNEILLGKYDEKRALEILDEIQYNIKNIGKCDLTDDGIKYYTNIYEMPEE